MSAPAAPIASRLRLRLRRRHRSALAVPAFAAPTLAALALALLADAAGAQVCTPALPAPGAVVAPGDGERGGKFALIAQACPHLAAPVRPHRAAQLDLYGAGASVGIPMGGDEAFGPERASEPPTGRATQGPASASATPDLDRTPAVPADRRTTRVLSLAAPLMSAARDNGLDPLLLHAIAHVESRHDPRAVSPAGARGVMQMMPATGRRFGVGDGDALFDAGTNLRASAAYLRTLMLRYRDDLKLVLAAYNAGEGAVDKAGGNVPPYPETQAYVRDVLAVYRRLAAEFAVAESGRLVARADARGGAR